MFRERCTVLQNRKVAPGHFLLEMACAQISRAARPGQFVQILCSDAFEPLLPRPFSFLTTGKKSFSILYQAVGKGTKILSRTKEGESLWVIGPLGRGFNLSFPQSFGDDSVILVGGGVGIPPLYHLARVLCGRKFPSDKTHVFLGARSRSVLLCEGDFKKLGVHVRVATDDGSKGQKGFVTESFENFARAPRVGQARVYACGPTPMLRAAARISRQYGLFCEVSVEVPMACGFGACLGCAIRVNDRRFAMACMEGPVFDAGQILWD